MTKIQGNISIDYTVWNEAKNRFDNVSMLIESFLRDALAIKNEELPKKKEELEKELEKQLTLTTKLKQRIKELEQKEPQVLREW